MDIEKSNHNLPHISAEFFLWLWHHAEHVGGNFEQDGVSFWFDDKLSFRDPVAHQSRTVVTGENSSTSPEAKAALAAGRVVSDVKMHLRKEEREYILTLKGPMIDISSLKFPEHSSEAEDMGGLLLERMFMYDEVWDTLGILFKKFAAERTSSVWTKQILPTLHEWVHVKS